MQQFTARFGKMIQGVVSGFDRLIFRGSLRQLNHAHGMEVFLFMKGVLFKDYTHYVKDVSQCVKRASTAPYLPCTLAQYCPRTARTSWQKPFNPDLFHTPVRSGATQSLPRSQRGQNPGHLFKTDRVHPLTDGVALHA